MALTDQGSAAADCVRTVLVVDDEDSVRSVTALMVKRLGYAVLTAEGGSDALALFRQHKAEIGAVLLDMAMPGMDGLEAFQQLRQAQLNAKVIMMSGDEEAAHASTGASCPKNMVFLHKPFSMDTLRQALA